MAQIFREHADLAFDLLILTLLNSLTRRWLCQLLVKSCMNGVAIDLLYVLLNNDLSLLVLILLQNLAAVITNRWHILVPSLDVSHLLLHLLHSF